MRTEGEAESLHKDKDGMKMKPLKLLIAISIFLASVSLSAQKILINRQVEKTLYPDLQFTEEIQDRNIQEAHKRFYEFGHLVALAQNDRVTLAKDMEFPPKYDFKTMFRWLQFTPRNTYVRYIEDIDQPMKKDDKGKATGGNLFLQAFGDPEEVKAMLKERIDEAKGVKVDAKELTWNGRKGIELTQFEFIYDADEPERKPVGSLRKTMAILYKQGADGKFELDKDKPADEEGRPVYRVDMVVLSVVSDNTKEGVKHVQVIIDPDPNTPNMDDVVIFDRYNQKPLQVTILGMMWNTPNYPHRVRFKQKFYVKALDHFFRLYRMVSNYARRDGNDYNERVIEKVEDGLTY